MRRPSPSSPPRSGARKRRCSSRWRRGRRSTPRSLFCESGSLGAVELERAVAQDDLWTSDCVDRLLVAEALETLPRREELILRLRYWDRLSQDQIARRLGISQMHVSRLARRGVARLSRRLADTP